MGESVAWFRVQRRERRVVRERHSGRPRSEAAGWNLSGHRTDTVRTAPSIHLVCCPYCQRRFNLFAASWCPHQEGEPSKVCPYCDSCLCEHPAYSEPHFWTEAPPAFQKRGFGRLFLFYL